MREFQVGQKVTVFDYSRIIAITTVAKVGKRKMKLSNGSEWKANGSVSWGSEERFYLGPFVREFRPEDRDAFFRQEARKKIENTNWNKLDNETLRRVLSALNPVVGTEAGND